VVTRPVQEDADPAGVATLLTNALPIAAGTIVLNETVPWEEHGATSEPSLGHVFAEVESVGSRWRR
jgi:hypothetical protein